MIKYMNQYAAESQELKQFEEWWKKQNNEAIIRSAACAAQAGTAGPYRSTVL